jgi:hypothetical protein
MYVGFGSMRVPKGRARVASRIKHKQDFVSRYTCLRAYAEWSPSLYLIWPVPVDGSSERTRVNNQIGFVEANNSLRCVCLDLKDVRLRSLGYWEVFAKMMRRPVWY